MKAVKVIALPSSSSWYKVCIYTYTCEAVYTFSLLNSYSIVYNAQCINTNQATYKMIVDIIWDR